MATGYRYKLKGSEITLNATANVVATGAIVNSSANAGASLVRIMNVGTNASVITQAGSIAATITVASNNEILLQKLPTDTLASSNGVCMAVGISFEG